MDQLTTCNRCNGNACYEQVIDKSTRTWTCMGCGFTTSTLMEEGGKVHTDLLETSPELYKDLLFKDSNNLVWAPSTVTLPGKGMVCIDGTSKDNWSWTAVMAVPLTEEEKKSGQYPEGNEFRMDMKNKKVFNKEDFMEAMDAIGFFQIQG